MKIPQITLEYLASIWPSPLIKVLNTIGEDPSTEDYHLKYAFYRQFQIKQKNGFPYDIFEKDILEIGCGHGGISAFLALNGAKSVTGIDLNIEHLRIAEKFKSYIQKEFKVDFTEKLSFFEEDAFQMKFSDESFDLVIADNVFEHFMKPLDVLNESFRILRPGGTLIIPSFNSIYSKYGAHLKFGLKMPWVNLFFSEKTICNTLQRMAKKNPKLYVAYPGIKKNPVKIRDLREYKDLNGITHKKFIKFANQAGFKMIKFTIHPPFSIFHSPFRLLYKIPIVKNSIIGDICSRGVTCILKKT